MLTASKPSVLTLEIAKTGMTRIEIEGEAIDDVMVFPKEAQSSVFVHPKGHLFLSGDSANGPIDMTLMTASGMTQDLHVKIVGKKASPIVLKMARVHSQEPSPVRLDASAHVRLSSKCVKWVRELEKNKIPDGFFETYNLQPEIRKNFGIESLPSTVFQGESHVILCFNVKGAPGAALDSQAWMQPCDTACVFVHDRLPEDGKSNLFVIQPLSER
jgi:hypothetical protein